MKKLGRIAFTASLVAVVLATGAALACLGFVDYQPYFRTPYYAATAARLTEHRAQTHLVQGDLEAGFGRALLTPTIHAPIDDPARGLFRELPLAGYGDRRGRPATGVHDDLYVKAVALRVGGQVVVLMGMDALIVPPQVTASACAQLERELHLRREQIYLSASHTHSSLGGWAEGAVGESFAGPYHPAARTWMAGQIVAAARAAVADLQPASVGQGSFAAPQLIRNRLIGSLGRVDPEFSYVIVRQRGGRVGVMGSFSAHATVLSGRMMEFSADYPGAWQRRVEQATGGLALFLAGGVGSQSPAPPEGATNRVEALGRMLAEPLLAQLSATPLTNQVVLGAIGLEMDLPPLNVRLSDGVRLRPWLAARVLSVSNQTFVQAIRIGEVVWLSTPCDFSSELALDLKDSLGAQGFHGVVTSFNGDYIGYLIPLRYYHLSGYEPRIMSFFGPYISEYVDEFLRKLAGALIHPPGPNQNPAGTASL